MPSQQTLTRFPTSARAAGNASGKPVDERKPPTPRAAWRQIAYMNAIELQHDLEESCHAGNTQGNTQTVHHIEQLLRSAYNALSSPPGFWACLNGESQERAFMALHEARARILSIMDSERLLAMLPSIIARCRGILGPNDTRVRAAEKVLKKATTRHDDAQRAAACGHAHSPLASAEGGGRHHNGPFGLTRWERATIAALAHDAYAASDEKYGQTRGLRNRILVLTAGAISVLILVVAAAAIWDWQLTPTATVAVDGSVATWADTPLPAGAMAFLAVSLLGCAGAFLSGIRSVSRTAGTRNPFSLSWWQSWLKLPVGALSAIVGVFALQSRAFPAVPATGWVELLMWAVAFGAAQQAVTRFVDMRVQGVIGDAHRADDITDTADPEDVHNDIAG